jgi:hypothetical protein
MTAPSSARPRAAITGAARSPEAPVAVAYAPEASSRMNSFRLNARRMNAE